MRSSRSSVRRRPAVSMKRKSTPSMSRVSSMASRVVPAMSETMARSSPRSRFSSVDLPALGAPTIATPTPCFRALPSEKLRHRVSSSAPISSMTPRSCVRSANSTSSSEKSSSSSSSEARCSRRSRNACRSSENPPRIWAVARAWDARDDEAIRSATASACARSILPARNARAVNSPGSAVRAPAAWSRRRISATT